MILPKDFKKELSPFIDWVHDYLNDVTAYPVKSKVQPKDIYQQIPPQAPEQPEGMQQILQDLTEIILPGITHWQHPNFHAYFPATNSVESIFAEFVTAAIGAQCMIWETSPAAAELEERMMEWLRDAMGLPGHFEGVIQDTASTASLVAILTAREGVTNFRSNFEGVPDNLRIYCSTQTHSSIEKGVGIAGIGRNNVVKIEVDDGLRMIPGQLEAQIAKDLEEGLKPCCVVAALGTTSTVAIDPLKEIADICQKYRVWLHVDAAYAGPILLLPEYRWMIEGIQQVDSFVFNPHKWMFTNFDCTAYFVRDPESLIRTFDILPEYLKTNTRGLVNDYRDWGIQLGRRFRALKLWFVMRGYGLTGLREKLREHLQLNQFFAEEIDQLSDFEIVVPPALNFTGFRYRPAGVNDDSELNQLNKRLLERINRRGNIFLTHTKIKDVYLIRMVIGHTYVEKKHVERALEEIVQVALELTDIR